jgi:hypothetical protein
LLAEPIVNEEEYQTENDYGKESTNMIRNRLGCNVPDSVTSNDVHEEGIRNGERHSEEENYFQNSTRKRFVVPGLRAQSHLRLPISFQPIFYFAENHFHKNGLWTNPSAKYSSKNDSEENDEDHEYEHAQNENEKVLRPKANTEDDVNAINDIQQE